MIEGCHPVFQAFLGTLFTFGLTALGSSLVYILPKDNDVLSRQILDAMLGFAAGVMLAASYWSLLAPAIEAAENMPEYYGPNNRWTFVPAAVGLALGAGSMLGAESVLTFFDSFFRQQHVLYQESNMTTVVATTPLSSYSTTAVSSKKKKNDPLSATKKSIENEALEKALGVRQDANSYRRVLLLVVAITIHNFPEGMAVGVGFGSIGQSESATFMSAVNLAIGIGLQNFPEGLAVSMPLRRAGMSPFKAFLWGSLSGIVEPFGGVLGAWAVLYIQPLLPYALSFAAGAMIFVVVDDLIPEASSSGNQRLATIGTILGFIVMMVMDVALG